jgi:hypothetical protein
VVARAQQPALPVIGGLSTHSTDDDQKNYIVKNLTGPFLQGLKETGYVEGQNVAIEYRWAENQNDRLAALAADLVRRLPRRRQPGAREDHATKPCLAGTAFQPFWRSQRTRRGAM